MKIQNMHSSLEVKCNRCDKVYQISTVMNLIKKGVATSEYTANITSGKMNEFDDKPERWKTAKSTPNQIHNSYFR